MSESYEIANRFVSQSEVNEVKRRLIQRGGPTNIIDPDVDYKWAQLHDNTQTRNPYYDYFFSGEDIKVYIAEVGDDPEFGDLPIAQFAFQVSQMKQPLYGFWNYCVDIETEALTQRGWLTGNQITEDDTILSMDPIDGKLKWSEIKSIFRNETFDGRMFRLTGRNVDALVTAGHKFLTTKGELKEIDNLNHRDKIVFMGEGLQNSQEVYSDAFVELVGWYITEGHDRKDVNAIELSQSVTINPLYLESMERALKRCGVEYGKYPPHKDTGVVRLYIGTKQPIVTQIKDVAPNRVLSQDFINSLSSYQRELLIQTMIQGDGWYTESGRWQYSQKDPEHVDAFVALCAMSGYGTTVNRHSSGTLTVTQRSTNFSCVKNLDFHGGYIDGRTNRKNQPTQPYRGLVWCPETEYGTFVCRRNGKVYVTGNTYNAIMRGTRIVQGSFILVSRYPNYMKDLLTKAAKDRYSREITDLRDPYPQPLDWQQNIDAENIQEYWETHIDPAASAQSGTVWSIHPPFSLVMLYGIQDSSVSVDDFSRSNERYQYQNALYHDDNHRLIDPVEASRKMKIILEGVELTDVNVVAAPGNLVVEKYDFLARDIIVPENNFKHKKEDSVSTPSANNPEAPELTQKQKDWNDGKSVSAIFR